MVSASALSNDEPTAPTEGWMSSGGESFAVGQRHVLRSVVVMVDQPGEVDAAIAARVVEWRSGARGGTTAIPLAG